jgi:hypothetical protein
MKVKMLTSMAGPEISLNQGDEADFPDDEAKRLIEAGIAVPAGQVKPKTRESKVKTEARKA